MTDDVRLTIEGTDQEATGREAVVQTIRFLHEQAFDAEPELKNLVAEAGRAAIEADFVGRHTGEFAGVPATGRDVRVPYSVVYDLDGDRIKAVRIYMSIEPDPEPAPNGAGGRCGWIAGGVAARRPDSPRARPRI